jgi:hypothetical protein
VQFKFKIKKDKYYKKYYSSSNLNKSDVDNKFPELYDHGVNKNVIFTSKNSTFLFLIDWLSRCISLKYINSLFKNFGDLVFLFFICYCFYKTFVYGYITILGSLISFILSFLISSYVINNFKYSNNVFIKCLQ